jgi:hypothetical protein
MLHARILTPRAWLHAFSKAYGMAFWVPRLLRTPTQAAPAPRPARVSPANKLPDIDPRLCISSSKVQSTLSVLPVVPVVQHELSPDCPVPCPQLRRHNPALVTPLPSKVQDHILPLLSMSNPLRQAAQEAHSLQFKPLALKKSSSALPRSTLKKRDIHEEDAVHAEVSYC